MNILEKIEKYIREGQAQDVIMDYLKDVEGMVELSDMAASPKFKGIHFGKIQSAAKALADRKKIESDGTRVKGLKK